VPSTSEILIGAEVEEDVFDGAIDDQSARGSDTM
jgi:hypothetical protein